LPEINSNYIYVTVIKKTETLMCNKKAVLKLVLVELEDLQHRNKYYYNMNL